MTPDLQKIQNFYFLGIGGIGMSALARYFRYQGKNVAGYDLTQTRLTERLVSEGISVSYIDDESAIPSTFDRKDTLVVYTPAIPPGHFGFNRLKNDGYTFYKRAQVLGMLCNPRKCIAVAGTHGKTTVSAMASVILKESALGCGAFLGGILKNYDSNLILPGSGEEWIVTEADEYDRSFLNLLPDIILITAIDPDHLDVYGNLEELQNAFAQFAGRIKEGGKVVLKKGIGLSKPGSGKTEMFSYSLQEKADYSAENIRQENEAYIFNLVSPKEVIRDIVLNYPGLVNVENAVGAAAVTLEAGASPQDVRRGLSIYQGIRRRFDIRFRNNQVIFIDDYAHHPNELKAVINSVKILYPGKRITGIFQPHLFSRTKDFADDFAKSLDLLDTAVILPIYPAREKPLKGVSSEIIIQKMKNPDAVLLEKDTVPDWVMNHHTDILMTLGAGDIDKVADDLAELLKRRYHV